MAEEKPEKGEGVPETLSAAASGIPELFYDFIGRLIPGAVMLFCLSLYFTARLGPQPPDHEAYRNALISGIKHMESSLAIALAIISAYLIGIVLDSVGLMLFVLLDIFHVGRFFREWEVLPSLLRQLIPLPSRDQGRWARACKLRNDLVPSKMRAEILMYRSLALGSSVLAVLFWHALPGLWLALAPSLFCACAWVISHRLTLRMRDAASIAPPHLPNSSEAAATK